MINIIVKFFCLLTPFFVLSLFLDVCKDKNNQEKHKIAIKTSIYIFGICILLLFFGNKLFSILGITLLSFQIGSGIVLLLSGISMMSSKNVNNRSLNNMDDNDPSLIPLTLPVTVGPGTIGTLFVISQLNVTFVENLYTVIGLFIAVFCIFLLLYFSEIVEKVLKTKGLNVLSKLTGLFLTILATQSILNGIENFVERFIK